MLGSEPEFRSSPLKRKISTIRSKFAHAHQFSALRFSVLVF